MPTLTLLFRMMADTPGHTGCEACRRNLSRGRSLIVEYQVSDCCEAARDQRILTAPPQLERDGGAVQQQRVRPCTADERGDRGAGAGASRGNRSVN